MLRSDAQTHPIERRASAPHAGGPLTIGALGLGVAAMVACGASTGSDGVSATDAGATDGGAITADAGGTDATDGGSASLGDGGTTTVSACTQDPATASETANVVSAAQALLATLTTSQQSAIQYEYTLANAQQWSNLPTSMIARNGVKLADMSSTAVTAAVALVTAATGAQGDTLFSELRAADQWLVDDGHAATNSYGNGLYYIAFLGTPSTSSPWMLQVAGHHLAYNFSYNAKCTSATPQFDGAEPLTWTDASGTTHQPLKVQQDASRAVAAAIASNADALLSGSYSDIVNGPANSGGKGDIDYPASLKYPTGTTGRGVLVSSLSAANQALVKTAIEAWVKNASDAVSTSLLAAYESDEALANTYVAYAGDSTLTAVGGYFRIDGPRVWIELTVQHGIIYMSTPHWHTIWRDKVADYGAEWD
jgi:hypothetical protein